MKKLPILYSETFRNNRFCPKENEEAYKGVYYVLSKNKTDIKPLLLLITAELFGGRAEEYLPAAYAMELFNYSGIVLQDVVDQYAGGNGRPSSFEQLTPSGSIITGDQLIILSYKYLSTVKTDHLREIMSMFNKSVVNFVKGQQLSLGFQQPFPHSFSEYINIISLQSAELTSLSLRIGALLGGASVADQDIMSDTGKLLGLGIQLQNEWESVYVKNELSPIESPFIYYKAAELADDSEKLLLLREFENKTGDRVELNDLLEKLNVKKITADTAKQYYNASLKALESLKIEKQKINKLVESINSVAS
jgi:geranylgeranyl diphosphate synthase, type II